jgi:glycosyltransferase involved in cell wall biosynthesis
VSADGGAAHATTLAAQPRVLFLSHAAAVGGAELCLLHVARTWPGQARVVLFEDGHFRHVLEDAGVDVHVLDGGAAFHGVRRESRVPDPRALALAARLAFRVAAEARDFDVVFANTQKAFVVASAASRLARRPLLWHLHDILDPRHFSASNMRIDVALGDRIRGRIVAVSHAVRDAYIAQGGDPDVIDVVHNGIRAGPFVDVTPHEAATVREELGLTGRLVVGSFSRISPWKGQHVLIEAAAAFPELHVLLVGGVLFGADDYAARLHSQVERLAIADRVHFIGLRDDVPRLLRACDIIVHAPTAPEPFARVTIEAMLSARPFIAARDGGTMEIVRHGETGLLFEPGSVEELRAALSAFIDDPERARAIGAAAREHASTHFSLEAAMNGIHAHIREVAAK